LGRTYFELGQLTPHKQEAELYFAKAVHCFEHSYQLNRKWGNELDRAYDWFRKAQVLQAQRQWSDAKTLRSQAGHIFRMERSVAILHVELEEARLALLEGNLRISQEKAEAVLHGWIQFNYTKGVADALKVLGEVASVQGHAEQAFEILATRFCVYPFDSHPSTGQVWEEMNHLQAHLARREGRPSYQHVLRHLQEVATSRQGYFSYLDTLPVDRSGDVAQLLGRLQPFHP
jgi:hypothetical protein